MGDMADYYREQAMDLLPSERAIVPAATAEEFGRNRDGSLVPKWDPEEPQVMTRRQDVGDFAEQLNDILEEQIGVPSRSSFNEEDAAFPIVRPPPGKSTFPVKERLEGLGCKWSAKRNAWVAPTPATARMGEHITQKFWAANPTHDLWTVEGAPQPLPPAPGTGNHGRRKRKSAVEMIVVTDGLNEKVKDVSDAFAAQHMAQVLAKADDANLVRELEKRGYHVRKISESELLREAFAAEGETPGHLLGVTDNIFEDLEAEEE